MKKKKLWDETDLSLEKQYSEKIRGGSLAEAVYKKVGRLSKDDKKTLVKKFKEMRKKMMMKKNFYNYFLMKYF